MTTMRIRWAFWVIALIAVGCDGGGGTADAGADAGTHVSDAGNDAGTRDAASDGGTEGADAGDDAGPTCGTDQRECGGACVSLTSPDACGPDCVACTAPDDATATCESDACGFTCDTGYVECDGACIPESRSCGVAIPDTCAETSECSGVAECIDGACACAAGYRACGAGCCPVTYGSAMIDGVEGGDVQLQFGPDGTAYILVQTEVASSTFELHLYTRAPGGAIERAALTIPVSYDDHSWDFAVRDDGTLFAAAAPNTGEGTNVILYEWREGMSDATSETIGSGFGYDLGVGLSLDAAQTVWVSWSTSRSGGLSAFSREVDDTRRTYSHGSSGTVEETDVEYDPMRDGVYSFWGHRYTGTFQSGVVTLSGDTDLSPRCPADDAAFDSMGHHFAVYDSYSSIHTYFCRDGVSVQATMARIIGTLPNVLGHARITIDGEDTAFVSTYDTPSYRAEWLASRDGETWSRGELPVHYGNPSGSTSAAPAYVAGARMPSGHVAFVVLPSDATMGPMVLATLD